MYSATLSNGISFSRETRFRKRILATGFLMHHNMRVDATPKTANYAGFRHIPGVKVFWCVDATNTGRLFISDFVNYFIIFTINT